VNGAIVPAREAVVSVFDRSFLYGNAVFEGLRCYDGRLFKLAEHTERLFRSAGAIGITVPMTREALNDAVRRTVRASGFSNAHIRPQVSRGAAWKLGLYPAIDRYQFSGNSAACGSGTWPWGYSTSMPRISVMNTSHTPLTSEPSSR